MAFMAFVRYANLLAADPGTQASDKAKGLWQIVHTCDDTLPHDAEVTCIQRDIDVAEPSHHPVETRISELLKRVLFTVFSHAVGDVCPASNRLDHLGYDFWRVLEIAIQDSD